MNSLNDPLPVSHLVRAALASALFVAAGASMASPTAGVSFGTYINAGGLKQGGDHHASAGALYAPNSNQSATASGDVHGFNLHALAWTSENPTLPSYCTVYTCSWQTFANTMVWDTIRLTAPPDAKEGETISFDFTIDGTKKRGKWAYGEGAYASASYYFGVDPTGWNRAQTFSLNNGVTVFGGSVTALPGESFNVYLMGSLSVSARSGSVADYSHTMVFHLDLPAGWTYTSASGRFSPAPSPVPEPTSMALMLAGLAGVGALKIRGKRDAR